MKSTPAGKNTPAGCGLNVQTALIKTSEMAHGVCVLPPHKHTHTHTAGGCLFKQSSSWELSAEGKIQVCLNCRRRVCARTSNLTFTLPSGETVTEVQEGSLTSLHWHSLQHFYPSHTSSPPPEQLLSTCVGRDRSSVVEYLFIICKYFHLNEEVLADWRPPNKKIASGKHEIWNKSREILSRTCSCSSGFFSLTFTFVCIWYRGRYVYLDAAADELMRLVEQTDTQRHNCYQCRTIKTLRLPPWWMFI